MRWLEVHRMEGKTTVVIFKPVIENDVKVAVKPLLKQVILLMIMISVRYILKHLE